MGHPSEVDEIFDAISYSKGASVIRMLHDYVGDKVKKIIIIIKFFHGDPTEFYMKKKSLILFRLSFLSNFSRIYKNITLACLYFFLC